MTLRATVQMGQSQFSPDGDRVLLTGSVSDIVDDLKRYDEAGVEYLVLSVAAADTESTVNAVKRFAEEVAPRV